MGKSLTALALVALFLFSAVTTSLARSRYHKSSYRSHYHSRPAIHHRYHYKSHYNHSDRYLTYLGVGLLTGAAISALTYRPVRERTIVYTTPPPVILHRPQVSIRRQYFEPTSQPDLILRRVETTAQLLNIRSGPGVGEMVTSQVQQGAILDVIGAAPDWLYVRTENGSYGWVMARYTRDTAGPVG
ncbi:MAG: SH3 domain-containing protein [Desulforhopalus sp.]